MDGEGWKTKSWWRSLIGRMQDGMDVFDSILCSEQEFQRKLVQERKRAERAGQPLLLMLLDERDAFHTDRAAFMAALGTGLRQTLRDTDICGALKGGSAGVILTEVGTDHLESAKRAVAGKVREMLHATFHEEVAGRIVVRFKVYPEAGGDDSAFDAVFYPDVTSESISQSIGALVKRVIDVTVGTAALLLLSPLFLLVPLAIKLTSKGPVLFIQERYGLNGAKFNMFKFRSMHIDNDDVIHRQFVKDLIEGKMADGEGTVYKITSDPRVTKIGSLLRAYSLDELPQLFNVLKGDMSLVGPRPPIRYEVEDYTSWQRNRLIGRRPGITGAWQVSGRSSTNFDDMVRLDLRYLKKWSVMLDIKIILLTPLVVLRCRGAY